MALPGWYSLSSVTDIHAELEAVAVIFFVALVIFDVWAHLDKNHEHLLERIGLICFAVAVLAEVCAYPYSRRVDTLSSEANAKLNKEAGDARRDAGVAMERAGKAVKDAGDANERSVKLELQAEVFRRESRLAELRLAEAQLALRILNMPRTIPGGEEFQKRLSKFKGMEYDLAASEESEPLEFMTAIDSELRSSGWIRKPYWSLVFPPKGFSIFRGVEYIPMIGSGVRVTSEGALAWDAISELTSVLFKGLGESAIKHEVFGLSLTHSGQNRVHIEIGTKLKPIRVNKP